MFALIGNFGPWEIGLVLVIVLIIFGPGKLPKVTASIGKAVRSIQHAMNRKEEEPEDDRFKQDDQ